MLLLVLHERLDYAQLDIIGHLDRLELKRRVELTEDPVHRLGLVRVRRMPQPPLQQCVAQRRTGQPVGHLDWCKEHLRQHGRLARLLACDQLRQLMIEVRGEHRRVLLGLIEDLVRQVDDAHPPLQVQVHLLPIMLRQPTERPAGAGLVHLAVHALNKIFAVVLIVLPGQAASKPVDVANGKRIAQAEALPSDPCVENSDETRTDDADDDRIQVHEPEGLAARGRRARHVQSNRHDDLEEA